MTNIQLFLDSSVTTHDLSNFVKILPLLFLLWALSYLVLRTIAKFKEWTNKKVKVMERSGWSEPAQQSEPIIATMPLRTRWGSLIVFVGGILLLPWVLKTQSENFKEELSRLGAIVAILVFLSLSIWSFLRSFNRFKLEEGELEKSSILKGNSSRVAMTNLESIEPYLNDLAMGADLRFSCGTTIKLRGLMLGYRSMLDAIALQNQKMSDLIAAKKAAEESSDNA